jgi:hypothetical protein
MEYEYANTQKKPILVFPHADPSNLTLGHSEDTDEGRAKLATFRSKVMANRMCKQWSSPEELRAAVTLGVSHLKKTRPSGGWVRSDSVASAEVLGDVLRLRRENEELRGQLQRQREQGPPGVDDLARGNDVVAIRLTYVPKAPPLRHETVLVSKTWDELFRAIAPELMGETQEEAVFRRLVKSASAGLPAPKSIDKTDYMLDQSDFEKILIQFRALGLIRRIDAPIEVGPIWTLTEHGDAVMTRLLAVRRGESALLSRATASETDARSAESSRNSR